MHMTGAWLLIVFIAAGIAATLLALHFTRLGGLIHENIQDRRHRRFFLASISFFATFLAVRLLVYCIRHHAGPFGFVIVGGEHIHYLVWGILILLLVGYGWLADVGNGDSGPSRFAERLAALLFGVGAALTLDEFAIWLSLNADAYWTRQGRKSVDAIILFGALLSIGAWGMPFFAALGGRGKKSPSRRA